ncbi:MAG: hypothetical protein JWQ29_321 [Phenylobacterium sp.]|nr:hypothetical protein [Phenylobacterium sp.]
MPACEVARDLIGADSGSIFWLDEYGSPAGFFHDCAPAELKDLFVTRFDELFSATGQFNMVTYTEMVGAPIGRMLGDEARAQYLDSNVYRYLAAPLGHHYCLDIRIEHKNRGVALLVLWNPEGRPFTQRDVEAAQPVRTLLEQALREERQEVVWRSQSSRTAHFITDISGEHLLAIDAEAEALLNRSQLLRQNVPIARSPREAPVFSRALAAMLAHGSQAQLELPVVDGRLVVRASMSQRIGMDGADPLQMFVSVDLQVAVNVLAAERLSALPLTLLQKQVALFGAQGGLRIDCEDRFGVSQEALKKHLRTIYDVTGVANWAGLRDQYWAEV